MINYTGQRGGPDPLAEPAAIAIVGDVHMNAEWMTCAAGHAGTGGADVIIQLGDFAYTFDEAFIDATEQALADVGIPLMFVDGNHEEHDLLHGFPLRDNGLRQVAPHIWHIPRGFRWTWGGIRFLGLGGAHSVDRIWRVPGVSWWPGEALTEGDVALAIAGGPADALIAHDAPAGVAIPGLDETAALFPPAEIRTAELHRAMVRAVVDATQPRFIWHGHYHRHYAAVTDFGYGPTSVVGLDRDDSRIEDNVQLVSMLELRRRLEVAPADY